MEREKRLVDHLLINNSFDISQTRRDIENITTECKYIDRGELMRALEKQTKVHTVFSPCCAATGNF